MVVAHWDFDGDVERVVRRAERRFPGLHGATYYDHPWPGWDGRSVDFWGSAPPEWRPISTRRGLALVRYLMAEPGAPWIRHWIFRNTLWTSWGGYSVWPANDHLGSMQHVHVTYWPPA